MMMKELTKPRVCGVCPFYSERPYQCHNERGMEANCSLGFMRGTDTRDHSYENVLFRGCRIKSIKIELD